MNQNKIKLLTISALITTGLCVSFNLAYPILWKSNESTGKIKPPKQAPKDLEIEENKNDLGKARKSYAS